MNPERPVTTDHGCPRCGESDIDRLEWDADGEVVTCTSCGHQYDPNDPGGPVYVPVPKD